MDMSSMSGMSMSPAASASTTGTATMSMAAASSAASGMDMGGNTCKISMTWNWFTVGACFISDTWQVTSGGMFAGSCIGVISLVISLEFLRRVQREYDGWIARKDRKMIADYNRRHDLDASSGSSVQNSNGKGPIVSTPPVTASVSAPPRVDRPTLLQRQVIRSLLHMVQFGVAYFIMLLAMYFNGYIIICIIIGAFLGAFIFSWDQLLNEAKEKPEAADITGCCG